MHTYFIMNVPRTVLQNVTQMHVSAWMLHITWTQFGRQVPRIKPTQTTLWPMHCHLSLTGAIDQYMRVHPAKLYTHGTDTHN